MRVITYIEFYRNFVQRKKQELLNPKFLNLSEISLPRNSLMHFYPRNSNEIGPSQSEALISTYGDDVFIDFPHEFNPTIGVGKRLAFEWRKEIKSYRGKHYNYNWTKNIDTVYRKEKVLIVKSYGLIDRLWVSRPLMFSKFTNYYDKQLELIKSINLEAYRGNRNQFIRIDLPNVMPSFLQFLVDYDHFVASFKDGVPVPNNKMVRLTKGEGSYWLLDFLALLMGDYKYTTYRELTPEAEASLHLVFTYNSRCLVLKLSVFKSWLDDLNKPEALELIAKKDTAFEKENQELVNKGKKPKDPENESHRALHPRRFNVTKRIYLSLLNLVRGGVDEEAIKDEETLTDERGKERSGSSVVVSTQDPETKASSDDKEEESRDTGEDEVADTGGNPTTLADVLSVNKKDGDELSRRGSKAPDASTDTTEVEEVETFAEADEEEEDYAGEVDDALLEEEVVKTEVSLDKNPFKEPASGVKLALEERAKEGSLSVAENKFFEKKANRYKEIKMDNGVTLEEFVKITDSEIDSLNNDAVIEADIPTVLDPSMMKSRTSVLRKNYVKKFLKKDTVNMFLGLQNAGICLNDFKHEEVGGVEGQYDVYSIQVHPVDGDQSTHHIRIPKVDDSGMFTVDGVKSHLQLQRMERPIRKIDKDRVVLTSYYPNQLMLTRSRKVVDNLGAWMSKRIVEAAKDDPEISYSRGSSLDTSLEAPRAYSMLSPMFQWIKVGKVTLDFRYEKLIEEYPEFKKFNKKDNFLIGVSDGKPLTIDSFGAIMKGGEFLYDLSSLLKIDMSKAPIETVVVNISGYLYPIGVLLCYYFGIDELIKITKLITRSVPMGTRLALAHDEFAIPFNDEYLVFSRTQKLAGLIFGGMRKLKNISNFSRSDLNDKGIWVPLMGDPKVKPQHFLEMKNLYDLFIDPITKEELRKLKCSESFHYLLIDAVKLLEIDKTSHEVEIKEQRIVGYERFAGHAYRELCKSTRAYRNKGRGRKHKFELNPEAVITNIITDVSVNLVEEVNPVHEVKDQEELTFGGTGGRTDISIVKRARVQLESYRGIVSEANKDSGKIGFITYLTSDALVADYRGNIAQNEEPTKAGLSSITGNLAFGIGKDD